MAAAPTAPVPRPSRAAAFGRFVARTGRELLYLEVTGLLGIVGVVYVFVAAYVGGLLVLVLLLGLPLIGLAVLGGRPAGAFQRALARSLLGEEVADPSPFRARPGFVGWIRSALTDLTGWRALAYLVLRAPTAVVGAYGVLVGWFTATALATYPLWWLAFDPGNVDAAGRARRSGLQVGEWYADTLPRALLVSAFGLGIAALLPWVARLLVAIDRALVRGLLGPTARDARVQELESTRHRAVVTADERLRQIERDLHDGAQARMAAVALGLGQVQDELDLTSDAPFDRQRAALLVDRAHANAMAAVAELRDLAPGIRPPVLEVGLEAALADLAGTSAVPIDLRVDLGGRRLPAELEAMAWFCAAELVANVQRHSGARRAAVIVALVGDRLRLAVTDDGRGGAAPAPASGLDGLAQRIGPVDGTLVVVSPPGGPTVVTVELPLDAAP